MKIDIGLVICITKALKDEDVIEIQELTPHVVKMLRKLRSGDTEGKSSAHLHRMVMSRSENLMDFIRLWMLDDDEDLKSRELFETILRRKADFVYAIIKTLEGYWDMQKIEDVWTTVESMGVLFEYWMSVDVGDKEDGGTGEDCDRKEALALFCRTLVTKLEMIVPRRREYKCKHDVTECSGRMMLLKAGLQTFQVALENLTDLPGKSVPAEELLRICLHTLVNPVYSSSRELYWKASVLLPKIARLCELEVVENLMRELHGSVFLQSLFETFLKRSKGFGVSQPEDWIDSSSSSSSSIFPNSWKAEALFGLLSDLIEIASSKGVTVFPDIDGLIMNTLLKGMSAQLEVAARNNAVYALGLIFEHYGDAIGNDATSQCVEALREILGNEDCNMRDGIFRDNVLAASARVHARVLDATSLRMIVPQFHKELPLRADVEENVAVLKFWNCWFHDDSVVSPNIDQLLDAINRVNSLYPSHKKIKVELSTLFENVNRFYPEKTQRLSGGSL